MKTEINIENYLTDERIKEIIEEELREVIRLKWNNELSILLSNISYHNVFSKVDEFLEDNKSAEDIIAENTMNIIQNLSSYSVFRSKDEYTRREDSLGQKIMNKAIEDNKSLIEKRVVEIINNYNFTELKDDIDFTIYECVMRKFKE